MGSMWDGPRVGSVTTGAILWNTTFWESLPRSWLGLNVVVQLLGTTIPIKLELVM